MPRTGHKPRVAFVHDYLNQMGGAERVLLALHDLFPDAPVYTTIAAPDRLISRMRQLDIRVSFMQHLPGVLSHHQSYLPLYPRAIESLRLNAYDLVISSSSAFAKAAIARTDAIHLCYCHTPMRWAWDYANYIAREPLHPLARALLPPVIERLRAWDIATASRVDHYIANSPIVAQRITEAYGRTSTVILPPVDVRRFHLTPDRGDYFLALSRLIPYKRIDLAVRACTVLGLPLKVIGMGRDLPRLRALAGPTVEFLGPLSDEQMAEVLARCRALIFPGEEDFGITPVEAQACGRPVIAYGAGGALCSVIPDVTGVFFHEQTVESLMAELLIFDDRAFDPAVIRRHAERFDIARFHRRAARFIAASLDGDLDMLTKPSWTLVANYQQGSNGPNVLKKSG